MGDVVQLRPLPHRDEPQRNQPQRDQPESERRQPEPLWREAVGRQLRLERVERDERIADVAGRAGVSPQYLSEVERGVKDPSSEVLAALSGALGLSVLDLSRRAGRHLLGRPVARPSGPVCLAA